MRPCSDDCGRYVKHYREECYPKAPWDPPNLPRRRLHERCHVHLPTKGKKSDSSEPLCAYRDDDPTRCTNCHRLKNHPWPCDCIKKWLAAETRFLEKTS